MPSFAEITVQYSTKHIHRSLPCHEVKWNVYSLSCSWLSEKSLQNYRRECEWKPTRHSRHLYFTEMRLPRENSKFGTSLTPSAPPLHQPLLPPKLQFSGLRISNLVRLGFFVPLTCGAEGVLSARKLLLCKVWMLTRVGMCLQLYFVVKNSSRRYLENLQARVWTEKFQALPLIGWITSMIWRGICSHAKSTIHAPRCRTESTSSRSW